MSRNSRFDRTTVFVLLASMEMKNAYKMLIGIPELKK
jgi:hypothetical protein